MRSIPQLAVSGLFSWASGVPKAKFLGPAVLWAIQQNPDVNLILDLHPRPSHGDPGEQPIPSRHPPPRSLQTRNGLCTVRCTFRGTSYGVEARRCSAPASTAACCRLRILRCSSCTTVGASSTIYRTLACKMGRRCARAALLCRMIPAIALQSRRDHAPRHTVPRGRNGSARQRGDCASDPSDGSARRKVSWSSLGPVGFTIATPWCPGVPCDCRCCRCSRRRESLPRPP